MSVAGRGATGRGGGGAAGSPRWQKPRHAKLSACGGEPPRAMAMRRDGDIAPYRNGTVQREWAKRTRVVRTATGRCGAMRTSRPTATGPNHGNGRRGHEWCARPRGDAARWGHRALPQRDRATGTGEGDTSGAHGYGAMRRDGDIAPYRQAARVVRTATGRGGAMRTSRPTAKPRGWCARQRDTATGIGGGHHGPWRGRGCGVPMGKKAISVSGVGAREIRQPNRNRLLRRGYWGHRPQGECRRKALRRRGRSAVRSFCRPSRCSVGALV